jgi:hypothetical protein
VATVTATGVTPELRTLTAMIRRMFPHDGWPDGPFQRAATAIQEAAGSDARNQAQLTAGLAELQARGFAQMDAEAALAHLKASSGSSFFGFVRANVITTLYDDREVWALLGYENDSFAKGGWIERGFADLDWLPDPRIEVAGS